MNGRHARHDHEIESKSADTIHHEIIDDLLFDDLLFVEFVEHRFHGKRQQHADKEIKPEQRVRKRGNQRGKPVHDTERRGVNRKHDRHLHGEFIHRRYNGNFVFVLVIGKAVALLAFYDFDLPFTAHDVDVNDADDTSGEEPERGDRQPEITPPRKAVILLEYIAVIERLPRALPEPERQQNARRGNQPVGMQQIRPDQRDRQPDKRLHEVTVDGDKPRIEYFARTLFPEFLF